jgi:alginate O-acetyltransferase complex protein AlgI
MIFSSLIFIYLFLPIVLLGYYLIKNEFKNGWLLISSLLFFAWGGVSYTVILIGSILINYTFGLLIQNNLTKKPKPWLVLGVSLNLALLIIFKYANFITFNLNTITNCTLTNIILPIGISFYTFHSISYLVDIYRGKCLAQKNVFSLSLYISMFSQLVAGPIIRYSDVYLQLKQREHSLTKFAIGAERFIIGLAKKVLIANILALVADEVFNSDYSTLYGIKAWLGIICYTFQIYFDFSGYSDMAIGLGKMFGFDFLENFDFPYLAKSVKEFWRKWHISLSSFFRDYVYIPLGGNRVSKIKQYGNLITVFFLTGLWHGASWSFIVWGLFHGFFMLLETFFLGKILPKTGKVISNLYTLLIVMFAWVLFRCDKISYAIHYCKIMFKFKITRMQLADFASYFNTEFCISLVFAILGSFGFFRFCDKKINLINKNQSNFSKVLSFLYSIISVLILAFLLILSTLYLTSGTYNPFIYYKF